MDWPLNDAHMLINKYLLPDLLLGKGPKQSIITRLKDSSKIGKGAARILSLGTPVI